MKTRNNLLQLMVLFIMAAFAAIHAADVSENDILAAARKWIADNAIFQAESPNAVPEKATQMTDADGKAMPLWRVDLLPAGYLVMSSDDTLPPVVTFNTNGSFDMPEGHPLPYLLKRQGEIFQAELAKPKTRGNEQAAENQARWNTLLKRTRANTIMPSTIITPALLTTKWDQPAPFDYLCPSDNKYLNRSITGCVATAFAQVLKYHEWPPAGQGTASNQDTKGSVTGSFQVDYSFPYDWSLMRDDYSDKWIYYNMLSDYFRPKTTIDRTDWAVSRLMLEMGVFASADYELDATGAYSDDFKILLSSNLKYESNIEYGCISEGYYGYVPQETLYPRIIADMTAGRPVLVSGVRYENGQREGHSFVADGLGTMGGQNYCHFNYGWSGSYNGWYLLTDGYDSYVIDSATTNIMPKPIPVFQPLSVEQPSSFRLSWDFPKRLTAEAFRLTKKVGTSSTVVSASIDGTARSYNLTGQSGTATYTLEAKVDGSWQTASDGVTITVKTNPTPMLALMCDDELNSVAGRPTTMTVNANNTLQSLNVTCSRPDMVANGSFTVSGSGASRTISFTPASGLVGNAILYLTGTDTVGNIMKKTVLLRVLENTLTWNTANTFTEASIKSLLTGRLVLLVSGKTDDPATNEFINTVCESPDIKEKLLTNYELWYESSLRGIDYFGSDYGYSIQPFIAILEPSMSGTRLRAHSGAMGISEAEDFLNPHLPYFSVTDELLPEGTTYSLELSILDKNADIRYRLDSYAPTIYDLLYTAPISLTETTTISVCVFKNGLPVSETFTKTYTFLPQVAKPVLNVGAAGFFSGSCLVTASCATAGATLRYTTDGSTPIASSPVFPADGLSVTDDAKIIVRAFKDGMTPSECTAGKLYSMNNPTPAEDFDYNIFNDEVSIYNYRGSEEAIIIPETIEGKPVTEFAVLLDNAKAVYIPRTLINLSMILDLKYESLEVLAVDSNHPDYASVDGVLFNKDLTELIFCPAGKKGDYEIPSGVTSIRVQAFLLCSQLTSVRIPNGVTTIESNTFNGCTSLTSIEIPSNVTSIGDYALYGCSALTSVSIPASVTTIGENAFSSCSALTAIEVDDANANYASVDGVLYNKALTELIKCPEGKTGGCEIPSSVTSIAQYAFSGCGGLTSISIPSAVTSIGRNAFTGCSGLTSIMIPSGLTSIGIQVFSECSGLTSITIPSSVTSLGYGAFSYCSGLSSITIPSSVTSIGEEVFRGCSGLISVTIPSSVRSYGRRAFYGCSSLTSLKLPPAMTEIPDGLLYDCRSLTSIEIPTSVRVIRQSAFYGCSGLTSISLPVDLSSIENNAFYNCSGLTSIEIPSHVAYLGNRAFGNCTGLTSIALPPGLTDIGDYLLYGCSSLTSVTIPSNVTSIGKYAFAYCTGLTSIEIPSSVTSIGGEAFMGCTGLTTITIPEGVTTIANYLFDGCTSLVSVSLPSSVTLIEGYAFRNCTSLTSLTIPSGVTEIRNYAFDGCTKLTELVFNGSAPFFYSNKGYPTPVTFSVPAGKGWEDWTVPSGVALNIHSEALNAVAIAGDDMVVSGGSAIYKCTATWGSWMTSTVVPTWSLSPEGYASVTGAGLVTNKNTTTMDQTVTLTASYTENDVTKTSSKTITLLKNTLTGIAVDGDDVIEVDDTAAYTCTASWSYGPASTVIPTWSLSPADYASVDSNGKVTNHNAMTDQTVILTATYTVGDETKTDTKVILVKGKIPSQTLELTAGWNWVSFYVLPESHKVGDVLGMAGFTTNDIIQTNGDMSRFTGASWNPSSFTVEFGRMYQIYVANDVTVKIAGENSELSTIPLDVGWNWIGNPTADPIALADLVRDGDWMVGDRIQSNNRSVIYTGSKWIPAKGFSLEPGKGYQLYTANEGSLEFSVTIKDDELYAVVDLSGGPDAASYPVRYTSKAPNLNDDTCRTTELWLRKIQKGTFIMGSPEDEVGRRDGDMSQHEVTITQDYYIGVFECTQKQWELVMGSNPSNKKGDCRPVEQVSYNMIRGSGEKAGAGWPTCGHAVDVSSFMGKLQEKTGLVFDLPTEAQRQYACRAGTTTTLYSGKNLTSSVNDSATGELARYRYNQSDGKGGYTSGHTKVGSYLPNAWGLYDMYGNVDEWCLDWWGASTTSTEAESDPVGPSTGSSRVVCCGGWDGYSYDCRSSSRGSCSPSSYNIYFGFRIALYPRQNFYAVVDLSGGPNAANYPVRYTDTAPDLNDDTCRTTELWLRKIPKGTFIMGSPEDEVGRDDIETQHEVTLTQDYYIGVFECTQRQWELVMGTRPSYFDNDSYYATRPVEKISFDMIRGTSSMAGAGWPQYGHTVDAASFMGKLQAKTGLVFDLPTEAQWEYACRAGTTTALNSEKNLTSTDSDVNMAEVGRYYQNGGTGASHGISTTRGTAKVGSYLPNAWGLYDMHGNVQEWCADRYNSDYYNMTAVEDPLGPNGGSSRVMRGGSWELNARYCRSAYRGWNASSSAASNYGFRIVWLP